MKPHFCYQFSSPGSPQTRASAGSPTTSQSSPSSLQAWHPSRGPRPWMSACGASGLRKTASPCGWLWPSISRASLQGSVSQDAIMPSTIHPRAHHTFIWHVTTWLKVHQVVSSEVEPSSSFLLQKRHKPWPGTFHKLNFYLGQWSQWKEPTSTDLKGKGLQAPIRMRQLAVKVLINSTCKSFFHFDCCFFSHDWLFNVTEKYYLKPVFQGLHYIFLLSILLCCHNSGCRCRFWRKIFVLCLYY